MAGKSWQPSHEPPRGRRKTGTRFTDTTVERMGGGGGDRGGETASKESPCSGEMLTLRKMLKRQQIVTMPKAGFSLTFEVEGHWLVSRQVPCKTDGRRPEPLGGSGGMLPRKIFRTKVSQECIFLQYEKEIFVL